MHLLRLLCIALLFGLGTPAHRCRPSRSQQGEEMTVYRLFFEKVPHGVFVEIGALDGYTYSNTYWLENCKGWRGLLVEGSTANFRSLMKKKKSTRPRSRAIHSAVCARPATHVHFLKEGGPTSGAEDSMSDAFKREWHKGNLTYERVPCAPMATLLQGMRHVDFWSVDVEGAELVVLSTVDWGAVQIDVIIVELDEHNPPKNFEVRKLLQAVGYTECAWGAVRGSALFVLNKSPYDCHRVGQQQCLCSYYDCDACCQGPKCNANPGNASQVREG